MHYLIPEYLAKRLHHTRLKYSLGAVASLATAVSVMVGAIAAHYAPRGFAKFSIALHLHREPTLVKVAAFVAGVAATIATAAGLLNFYSWWVKREDEQT